LYFASAVEAVTLDDLITITPSHVVTPTVLSRMYCYLCWPNACWVYLCIPYRIDVNHDLDVDDSEEVSVGQCPAVLGSSSCWSAVFEYDHCGWNFCNNYLCYVNFEVRLCFEMYSTVRCRSLLLPRHTSRTACMLVALQGINWTRWCPVIGHESTPSYRYPCLVFWTNCSCTTMALPLSSPTSWLRSILCANAKVRLGPMLNLHSGA